MLFVENRLIACLVSIEPTAIADLVVSPSECTTCCLEVVVLFPAVASDISPYSTVL